MAYRLFSIIVVLAFALPTFSMAILHKVGGSVGWTINDVDYAAWTQTQTFSVGDQLLFAYNPQYHNVFKVNQTEFANCTVPPNQAFNSGHDIIPLATPGKQWYISGKGEDCSVHKQKVAINVLAAGEAPVSIAHRFGISGYLAVIPATLATVMMLA